MLPPPMDPLVQRVVQVEVGQQGRNAPPLRDTFVHLAPRAVFQHPGVQPFLDVPLHAAVGDAVRDKLHHPVVVHRVEEPPDVRVEHPAYLALLYRHRHGVQRVVLAAPGPEPVR